MSLLHDALKKAEQEKGEPPPGEAFVDLEEPGKKRPIRVYLLAGLTVVSLFTVFYLEFYRKGRQAAPAAIPAVTAQKFSSDVSELSRQAEERIQAGEWDQARPILEQWVLLEPRNAEAYNNLGVAYKKTGDRERAREHYRKALAIQPEYPEALNNLGVLFLSEGKVAEAEENFLQAVKLRENYAEPLFHLALIEEAGGRGASAREHFARFLALSPELEKNFAATVRERMERLASEGGS